ncbi:MAG: response regulator transcription factor [Bacteroidales bacterium]|jgi:two-component system response regulator NreC|nr:response regulator transcription factor [Bacteroidales bacterium]MBR6092289.1 response regulator transcription factor [Bacteroidales bacterium]
MNIALLDDHDLIRAGIRSALSGMSHTITIDASNADDFFADLINGTPCDLVLLDVLMPGTNGIEVAQRLRTEYPDIKIIIVSVDTKEYIINQLMQIGIDGFISKNGPLEEVCAAVSSVEEGIPYYGHDLAVLIRDIVDARLDKNSSSKLSKRELEIIEACCSGLMGKEIAEKLHISLRAVNSHKTNIFNKLGLSSSVEMVRFALEHGII